MSVRFIHTADWQIGMKAAGLGTAATTVRDARIQSIERILELADDRGVDFLLITGDLFEDNAVDRLLIRKVGDLLARFSRPVFIIPGNHDPLVPGSVWEHPVWAEASNITVAARAEPIELDRCVLYPCPLKEKYSTQDPTSWIDARQSEKIAIGLAHGNVEGLPETEPDYPIPRDASRRRGLDYLAVGHWHSHVPYPEADGSVRLAYSGTHETSKFGERDSGNLLVVEIPARGATPVIECIPTGSLRWMSLRHAVNEEGSLEDVLREVRAIENPETVLLRLSLSGLLFTSDRPRLSSLREIVGARFLFGAVEDEGLIPAPEDDAWIETLPGGPLREAAVRLRQQAVSGTDEQSRTVAARALIELFDLKEQSGT